MGLAFAALIFAASIAVFLLAPPTPDPTAASNDNTGSHGRGGDTCANDDEECRNANMAAAESGVVQSAAMWKVALEALVLAVTVQ